MAAQRMLAYQSRELKWAGDYAAWLMQAASLAARPQWCGRQQQSLRVTLQYAGDTGPDDE